MSSGFRWYTPYVVLRKDFPFIHRYTMPNPPAGPANLSAQATHPPPFKPPPEVAELYETANYNVGIMLNFPKSSFETSLQMYKQTGAAVVRLLLSRINSSPNVKL